MNLADSTETNGTSVGAGHSSEEINLKQPSPQGFLLDLVVYLAVMFLVREISMPNVDFLVNGLFWSLTTLLVATWRMRARGISWKGIGLRKPKSYKAAILATVFILVCIPILIIAFEIIKDLLPIHLAEDTSNADAVSKFGNLQGNWILFFTIMPLVLLQSTLEELLDRGFLINWIERTFSSTTIATVLAVVLQAAIFGFRHSYDLSTRSVTVGLIGLVMGVAYVAFGRNLWPLIIAHCVLNGMSMVDRVV